jgi:hypothetical protein
VDRNLEAVVRAVEAAARPVTKGELVASTGLPVRDLRPALHEALRRFRSVLHVTDAGELLYDFGALREQLTPADLLAARLRQARDAIVAVAVRAFKVWTLAMLVLYGVFYAVVLMAVVQRLLGGRPGLRLDATRFRREVGTFARGLAMGDVAGAAAAVAQPYDATRPLHERVSIAMFGVRDPYRTRPERDRAFLAWAVANGGLVAASDWTRLFGSPRDEAEREAARVYAEYGADVRVGESGTVIYDYGGMLATGRAVPWERASEPPEPWASRETHRRTLVLRHGAWGHVLGLASLMLAGSAFLAFALDSNPEWSGSAAAWALLVWLPGAFASCVLATSLSTLGRIAWTWARRRRCADLLGRVFWDGGAGLDGRAAAAGLDLDPIRREQADLATLRRSAPGLRNPGKVVYSTDDREP